MRRLSPSDWPQAEPEKTDSSMSKRSIRTAADRVLLPTKTMSLGNDIYLAVYRASPQEKSPGRKGKKKVFALAASVTLILGLLAFGILRRVTTPKRYGTAIQHATIETKAAQSPVSGAPAPPTVTDQSAEVVRLEIRNRRLEALVQTLSKRSRAE